MEDSYISSTSQNESYSNITYCDNAEASFNISYVVTCVTIAVSFPLTLAAIYAVFSLVRKDNVAPIYVINLLISDLLQLCSMIVEVTDPALLNTYVIFVFIYFFSLMVSVGFMMCVALERYLVIVWPLWYRFRQTIKISLMVCGVVWALPLLFLLLVYFWIDFQVVDIYMFVVYLLLPYPVLIFSLGGTLKALSAATFVPPDEKRRIVALLVLVLLIYTLLFLPTIIWYLPEYTAYCSPLSYVSYTFIQFSPFADSFLYVLLRKGTIDKLLASLCCCRMETNDISTSTEHAVNNV